MAKLVRIKGKLIGQESKPYTNKDGEDKIFYILSILKDDGTTKKVASYPSQAKLKGHYVEIIAYFEQKGQYKNYKLKTIKEQEGHLNEEVVSDEEEIISDDDIVDDEGGETPHPSKKGTVKEDVNTEQGNEIDSDIQDKLKKKDKRDIRSIVISYAKDLCVGGKIEKSKIIDIAQGMFEYIWNGAKDK